MNSKTRKRFVSSIILLCSVVCGAKMSAAQNILGGDPEQLKNMLTERVRQATGLDLSVGTLNYEVFTSTFVATDVEAGHNKHNYLQLGTLRIEASLAAGADGAVMLPQIEGRGGQIDLPSAWFGLVPQNPGNRPVKVGLVRFSDVNVQVSFDRGRKLKCSGAKLEISDLNIASAARGKIPPVTAKIKLSAEKLALGDLNLTDVELAGSLGKGNLTITYLRGKLLNGKVDLKGQVRLAGGKWGVVKLNGQADVRLVDDNNAKITGVIKLKGGSLMKLSLEGDLKSSVKLASRKNEDPVAPLLPLKIKIGSQTLTGSLANWQLK